MAVLETLWFAIDHTNTGEGEPYVFAISTTARGLVKQLELYNQADVDLTAKDKQNLLVEIEKVPPGESEVIGIVFEDDTAMEFACQNGLPARDFG